MSEVWETKDGRRRIRRDPPTLEEAVVAAQGLTEDFKGQVEIVASLMEVSVDEARGAVLRMGQRKGVNHVTVTESDLYEDYGFAEFNGDDSAVNGCSA